MKPYQKLEHTTDLKIRAWGKTEKELFANMLKGMFESIDPVFTDDKPTVRDIKINSPDKAALLVDFLNEALYLSDINNEAYLDCQIDKLTDKELEGKLRGRSIAEFKIEIKAVTYHDVKIEKKNGGWEATVLFDI